MERRTMSLGVARVATFIGPLGAEGEGEAPMGASGHQMGGRSFQNTPERLLPAPSEGEAAAHSNRIPVCSSLGTCLLLRSAPSISQYPGVRGVRVTEETESHSSCDVTRWSIPGEENPDSDS